MKKMNLKYGLIAVVAMGFSVNVNAQDITCDDITFNPQAFTAYAAVDQACQEVVERNGSMYAKLLVQVQVQNSTGTRIKYYHRDGSWGKEFLVKNRNMVANFDGKDVRVKDLPVRQEANVYLPASEAFVINDVVVAEVIEEVIEEEIIEEVIEEEIYEETMPVVLPTTAGPLPWLALFGSLFLLAGGALRFSRKQ